MKQFFVDKKINIEENIEINKKDSHHLINVLRYQKGKRISLRDKQGSLYLSEISSTENNIVNCFVIKKIEEINEVKPSIILVQAITKSKSFNLILQKCTELGVREIVPLISERSVIKISDDEKKKKLEKWQKICEEAAKQSKRKDVPLINRVIDDISDIKKIDGKKIAGFIGEKNNRLKDCLKNLDEKDDIVLVIGPEGGFDEKELLKLNEKEVCCFQMSDNILRSETATITAVGNIIFYFS